MPAPLNDKHSDFPALEESRAGIRSFLLYYYETLLSLGYSVKDAKQLVAQLAKEEYENYMEMAQLKQKSTPQMNVDVVEELKKIIKQIESMPKQVLITSIHQQLYTLLMKIERKRR